MKVYRDPLLKMVHNPGGDWNPGRGDNPTYVGLDSTLLKSAGNCCRGVVVWLFFRLYWLVFPPKKRRVLNGC